MNAKHRVRKKFKAPPSFNDADREYTHEEIGAILGMTKTRSSQLERTALRALWRMQVNPEFCAARVETVAKVRRIEARKNGHG